MDGSDNAADKNVAQVLLTQNPNDRIAPWYGVYTIEAQHEKKRQDLQSYLAKLGKENTMKGVLHARPYTAYRNSNKFTFGYGQEALGKASDDPSLAEALRLGFIGGAYPMQYILPYQEAITIDATFKEIAGVVEKVVQGSGLKPFMAPPRMKKRRRSKDAQPYAKHQGVWKYVTVRRSVAEGTYMVCMVNFVRHLAGQEEAYHARLAHVQEALEKMPQVSIFAVQAYHATLEPQPWDPVEIRLDRSAGGTGTLCETLLQRRFAISVGSFFQVNKWGAEALYTQMGRLAKAEMAKHANGRPNVLLDMYCGTGSIGMALSDAFDRVIGIDEVASSIEDARTNAKLNGVMNAHYLVGRCEESLPWIQEHLAGAPMNLYMVVNPSREGLHKKVRRFIQATPHVGLIYASCNVQTWARDVADLVGQEGVRTGHGKLDLQQTFLVDLFPHTRHYEVLSWFTRVEGKANEPAQGAANREDKG